MVANDIRGGPIDVQEARQCSKNGWVVAGVWNSGLVGIRVDFSIEQ